MSAENGPASSATRKTGPEKSAATKQLASESQSRAGVVVPLPLLWARQLTANATGPVPEYGTPAWVELPDDSREKVASCVLAAEAWRTRRHIPEHFPSTQSRRIAEARRPRPGDFTGGPVSWDDEAVRRG